ncbi:MAG TPA: hypothetical protein VF359_08735 [Anaerolineales bacterium]
MADGPTRFFGLDIHKEYFVAVGVNMQRQVIFGPQRVSNYQLAEWAERVLTLGDAVALEMSTNTYLFIQPESRDRFAESRSVILVPGFSRFRGDIHQLWGL